MDPRIGVVKSKLAALQQWESRRNRPCVSETAIMAFESAHEVHLPAPYRDFLLHVGDGGPGPWEGLLPLASWHDALEDSPAVAAGVLAAPSPLLSGRELAWDEEVAQGAIALCARMTDTLLYTLLIVTGPARGRVCTVDCNEKRLSLIHI